ncbi:MAG: outer membrane protein assembly factor BamD [Verrucomicrobiae bacterium]|nr:outer membrane protein assembly factor BamD [Verrucomicrobiae bacterium]
MFPRLFHWGTALFIFAGFIAAQRLPAPVIYRPGQGWEVEGKESVEETSREQLAKAEKYEKDGKYEEAKDAYGALVKTWPLSPNAAEAQYRYGTMLYKVFEFQISFKEFQKCLEKYPDTEHFEDILKYQYDIGCLFLAGERQKLWKIPTLPSMDKTVEMFEQVIKNGPYSKVAPAAQLKIGFAREKQHRWDDAVKAYQELIRKYPKSNLADDSQFQIGYTYYLASKEADYDQTATNRAITAFQDYVTKYPASEKIEQANEYVGKLKAEQARGYLNVARYYDGQKKFEAASVYYNKVIQEYPNTELAKDAVLRLEQIKKKQFDATHVMEKKPPAEAVSTNAPPVTHTNLATQPAP